MQARVAAFPELELWVLSSVALSAALALLALGAARFHFAHRDGDVPRRGEGAHKHRGGNALFAARLLFPPIVVALPAPIVGNLFAPFFCPSPSGEVSGGWGGMVCWGPSHSAVVGVSAVLLILGVPFLVAAAAFSQSRFPDLKTHPTAVASGRVAALTVAVQTLLTIIYIAGPVLPFCLRVVSNIVGSALVVVAVVYYLPFVNMRLNQILASHTGQPIEVIAKETDRDKGQQDQQGTHAVGAARDLQPGRAQVLAAPDVGCGGDDGRGGVLACTAGGLACQPRDD
jgi:hypothetical protein